MNAGNTVPTELCEPPVLCDNFFRMINHGYRGKDVIMRILHTADWHLGDRLGRIDRTDDLRRAVERVAGYCLSEKADVLLVAGDIFSEVAGPTGCGKPSSICRRSSRSSWPAGAPS